MKNLSESILTWCSFTSSPKQALRSEIGNPNLDVGLVHVWSEVLVSYKAVYILPNDCRNLLYVLQIVYKLKWEYIDVLLHFLTQIGFWVGNSNLNLGLLQAWNEVFVSFTNINFLPKGCSNLLYVSEVVEKIEWLHTDVALLDHLSK